MMSLGRYIKEALLTQLRSQVRREKRQKEATEAPFLRFLHHLSRALWEQARLCMWNGLTALIFLVAL